MPVASLDNIEKTFGPRTIFNGLSFQIDRGERVGLIGDNGAGKSTLFKLLVGELAPDAGAVSIARGTRIGHLRQDPVFDHDNSVIDEAEEAFAQLHALSHRLRELEHEMAGVEGEDLQRILKRYQQVQHDFELAGGYAWRHRLEATLHGVGLDEGVWGQKVTTLSGGQRSRLALAKLLIAEPDLLLLDEPTNHLDLAAIEWLENYLLSFDGAVLLISHDRYLLDRLATRIVWLTRGVLRSYPGNYSAFIAQREVQELSQQRAFEQQQADIEKQKEFIRRFGAGQRAREAKGREKRLNRLLASDQLVQAVDARKKIRLAIGTDQRAGDQVLQVKELSKAYDGRVLWQDAAFALRRGDRVGIIGPNGSGKTTLLEVLLGRRDADGGSIRWGANLNLGYYDQRLGDLDPEATVFEEVMADRDVTEQAVRDVLASLLFRGDDIYKTIRLLSGGERARVRLAQLLLDRPNVLLLDEPTNHLDIASSEALEQTLRQFEGTILCVSHDRYFLNRIAKRLLVIEPPKVRDFGGSYSEWSIRQQEEAAEQAARAAAKTQARPQPRPVESKPPAKKKDNPYARPFGRLSTEELEAQITETEMAIGEAQLAFGSSAMKDPAQAKKLKEEYEALTRRLEQLEEEYFARGE